MSESSPVYTAISFAPVQGFIEKSRKLRDLFGASLILSYLSQKIVEKAEELLGKGSVISPGLIEHQEGMPNRILVRGELTREIVEKALLGEWQKILRICREWVEDSLGIPKEQYHWSQKEDQVGKEKGEWERWGSYTWEIFIGWGRPDSKQPDKNLIKAAMDDLETRKLKRDWVAINWVGESSSLSGTDAIAWHRLGEKRDLNQELTQQEKHQFKEELELFYYRLAWRLDNPERKVLPPFPELEELKKRERQSKDKNDAFGKYVAPNERLSIPELVKRLVTYEEIAEAIGMNWLEKGFTEIARMPEIGMEKGRWTGWFMGDGDEIGKKLKAIAGMHDDEKLQRFSLAMRDWGHKFEVSPDLGRVIYAGGDDFLGVLYTSKKQPPLNASHVLQWLLNLPDQWKDLQTNLQQSVNIKMSFSVGFVWAGHSVPQRDILQHCREAEKRAKNLGRDRVTIRVVFNSGQYVQWTCPWTYLDILTKYCDRNGKTGSQANWSHLYGDWAMLKARHVIPLKDRSDQVNDRIALKIFELYFDDMERFENHSQEIFKEDYTPKTVIEWLDGLVNVGWQLCSHS